MRLGIRDQKVIHAFVERRAAEGPKLSTDGRRLDGHWLGGARIADWSHGGIVFHDKGSRAAESVQKQIRYHAAPNQIRMDLWRHTKTRGSSHDPPTRRRHSKTREEYLASLRWNIKDAKEALHNAVDMSDWRGVEKYTKQLHVLERKLFDAETDGARTKRLRRHETWAEQSGRLERQREYHRTGRRGIP